MIKIMFFNVIIINALLCLNVIIINATYKEEWHKYKKIHSKVYNNSEDSFRLHLWSNNMNILKEYNNSLGYKLAINHFGDLTQEEIARKLLGFKPTKNLASQRIFKDKLNNTNIKRSLPDYVDWREHNIVSDVRDQTLSNDFCRSDYVFAATASLEGALAQKLNYMQTISDQNFLDCSVSGTVLDTTGIVEPLPYSGSVNEYQFTADGCDGGNPEAVFQYSYLNGYVPLSQLPYIGKQNGCSQPTTIGSVPGFAHVFPTEEDLVFAVANYGPIGKLILIDYLNLTPTEMANLPTKFLRN